MYLIRYTHNEKICFTLIVIDSVTHTRIKRYVNNDFAKHLMAFGIKCYETINQEVKEA